MIQQADRFLYYLVLHSGRRGRSFIVKEENVNELSDKWLCLMADVDPIKLPHGNFSKEERRRLIEAAITLQKLPIYVEPTDDTEDWASPTDQD